MRVEVDQSGKIENTNKPTVVCFSNRKSRSVIILAKDKRYLQQVFRKAGKPRMFVIQTFACLVYFLVKDNLSEIWDLVIDREYPGFENLLKSYLTQLANQDFERFSPDRIYFAEIGRKSPAHLKAYRDYQHKRADKRAGADDILSLVLRLK